LQLNHFLIQMALDFESFYTELDAWLGENVPSGVWDRSKKPPPKKRFQNVAVTIWYPQKAPRFDGDEMETLAYQLEKGNNADEKTQGFHLQLFCAFKKRLTAGRICDLLSIKWAQCHMETAKHPYECYQYCQDSKKDTYHGPQFSNGPVPPKKGQGRRSDLHAVAEMVEEGKTMEEIGDQFPVQAMLHNRGIQYLMDLKKGVKKKPQKRDNIHVYYLHGPSGCGKTRTAYEVFPEVEKVMDNKDNWFDGYHGGKVMLIDEFKGLLPRNHILSVCDRYPHVVPIKGAFIPCHAETIIFTSNDPPENFYPENHGPWMRRLNEFGGAFEIPAEKDAFLAKLRADGLLEDDVLMAPGTPADPFPEADFLWDASPSMVP